MAPAKKKADGTKRGNKVKLTKADPDFYRKIGKLGGKSTLAKKGVQHFASAARLSHKSPNRTGSTTQSQPEDDHIAGTRDKVRSRTRKTSTSD